MAGSETPLRIAIVGLGKIARDQHVPSIARTPGVQLVATASPDGGLADLPSFGSLEALLADGPAFDAVAICTPPQLRRGIAETALRAGKHALLEKPPGATLSEIAPLAALAREVGRTMFVTWHSRFAPAVEPARAWLAARHIKSVVVNWKEDVRVWHPGQRWLWEPGGLGVFDPGINALSILTRIMPSDIFLTEAMLDMPANCHTPIRAELVFTDSLATPITVAFDFLQTGPQFWNMQFETDAGSLTLDDGGNRLVQGDQVLVDQSNDEYPALYQRLQALVAAGACDVDLSPMTHVADAFLLGRRRIVDAFYDPPQT